LERGTMKIETIPIEKITSNPMQPREKFDREKLEELAESIKTVGIMVPLIVRPKDSGYEIVSGQRRWEAAKAAKLKQLTVIIKELDDTELAVESLIANEFRENLDPWERAKFLKRIKKMAKLETDAELGKLVGMSKSAVGRAFEYLQADDEIREKVAHGQLDRRAAREIASIPDKKTQREVANVATKQDLTYKQTEKLVSTIKSAPEPIRKALLKEKIDVEDVAPIMRNIPEKKVPRVVEELTERKKMRGLETKAQRELDEAFVKGELDADKIKIIRSQDEQIRDKILKVRDSIVYMPPTALKQIQTEKIKKDAIQLIKDIVKAGEKMLQFV
jgi:ParB family chromosome partitioning protein